MKKKTLFFFSWFKPSQPWFSGKAPVYNGITYVNILQTCSTLFFFLSVGCQLFDFTCDENPCLELTTNTQFVLFKHLYNFCSKYINFRFPRKFCIRKNKFSFYINLFRALQFFWRIKYIYGKAG